MSEPNLSPDEVPHSRARGSSSRSLLLPGLAIGGLLLVPAIGLVYASTTSFGKGADDASSAAPASDDADDEAKPTAAPKKSTSKKAGGATATEKGKPAKQPRTDEAAECCKALADLAKDAPVEQRAAYLSASQSCEAATTPTVAKKRVKNQLRLAKIDPPPSCED
jgi:hypothetical protein